MFCYQENTKDLSAVKCRREDFWKCIRDRWKKKGVDKKLLAWADDLKRTLPAFTFCCYEFDKVKYKPKKKHKDDPEPKERMVTRRQLTGCHLNGLVMLDIDHVENPMGVWERLQQQEELMKRVVLVHLTSSGQGIRMAILPTTVASTPHATRLHPRKRISCSSTRRGCSRTMTRPSTRSTPRHIERSRRNRCIISSATGIVIVKQQLRPSD